jgi:glycosyltransferase involved in cell wall biosynthesis
MSSVDVIVPCYGYGHFLETCVESVLTQPITDLRVLILDDASPDDTAEVSTELARKDSRVTFTRHIKNKGHIATYNEGIEWASADYMLLLSADDYLLPGALRRATHLMEAHPEVGFTFGPVVELYDDGSTKLITTIDDVGSGADQRILSGREFIELSGSKNIVATATAVVCTELQKRVGGYRPELTHAGDMEMWLRLAAQASVGWLPTTQAVYRCHSGCMSLSYYKNYRLLDLQQRKSALDSFVQYYGHSSTDAKDLVRRMLRSLGGDAISWASTAFNEGEIELSEELSQFALSVCPDLKRSASWLKLACKRGLGLRRWLELQPTVEGLRQLMLLAKDRVN